MADKGPVDKMDTTENAAAAEVSSDPAKDSATGDPGKAVTKEKAADKVEAAKKNGFSNVSPSYSQLQSGLQDIVKSYVASKSSNPNKSASTSNSKSAGEKNDADNGKRKKNEDDDVGEEKNYFAEFLDRTKSDYYCKVCDSHMNSEQMWENHIQGKRHLKNIKKDPGEPPSKIKAVRTDLVPKILRSLDSVTEPVVGLDYMCELQRAESYLDPTYSCFLCHATCTVSNILDHILGTKHRLAYLKEVNPEEYILVEEMKLKKSGMTSIAEDYARELERKRGRGNMEVKIEKPKMAPPPSKRERRYLEDSDEEDMYWRRSRSPHMESGWRREHDRWSPSLPGMMSSRSMAMGMRFMNPTPNYAAMSMMEKLDVLRQVSSNLIVVSESEGRDIIQIVNSLTQSLLQYKIRVLPPQLQDTLARHIMSGNAQGLENTLGLGGSGMANVGSVIHSMAASGELPMRSTRTRLSPPDSPAGLRPAAPRMGVGNNMNMNSADNQSRLWGPSSSSSSSGYGTRMPSQLQCSYPSTSQWQGGMGGGQFRGSDRSSLGY